MSPWIALLAGCGDPSQGTFIGNPDLTAEIAPAATQVARSGQLVASAVVLQGCEEGEQAVGPATFTFEGFRSLDAVQIPEGRFCSVYLEIDELTVRFDDGADAVRAVTARDFALTIGGEVDAAPGERFAFTLGESGWLDGIAAATEPGETVLDGSDPDLEEAFLGGLEQSAVGDAPPAPLEQPLPGRLNLDGYPASPLGTPTTYSGCVPGNELHLAVPIPQAAMAAAGFSSAGVGWCEGFVKFSDDLTIRTATQTDYSDLSTWEASYNGWGEGCDEVHCNEVLGTDGVELGRPCTVLALCDAEGEAAVTGFTW